MLELYLKPGCPYCANTIRVVESKNIKHKKIILETEEDRNKIKKKHNYQTFPQVFFNGRFIGGDDDFTSIIDMCSTLNTLLNDVNDDVLTIIVDMCCELSTNKKDCKIKKLLTQKKNIKQKKAKSAKK